MRTPGPWLYEYTEDEESLVIVSEQRRENKPSNITPSATVVAGILEVVERKDISKNVAWEIKRTIAPSPFNSLATAKQWQKTESWKMPARLNVQSIQAYHLIDEFYKRPLAENMLVDGYTWYPISLTKPTVPSDPIIPTGVVTIQNPLSVGESLGGPWYGVLIDGFTQQVGHYAGQIQITYPSSIPSRSVYEAVWVGTKKIISAEVLPMKYSYLWRCQIKKALMF